jgi:DNA polymerase III delta prime subunit
MEKYLPHTIKDIIGHTKQINEITEWLKKFKINKKNFLKNGNQKKKRTRVKNIEIIDDDNGDEDNGDDEKYYDVVEVVAKKNVESPCILITGNHGVGKTVAINTILNELKYSIIPITFGKNKLKDIKKIVSQVLNVNMIRSDGEKNKHIIVIDSLEAINSNVDKIFINTLFKVNNDKWIVPLVIISNGKHSKLLHEIKKKTKEIKFMNPNIYDMIKLIDLIIDGENMSMSNASKNKIVEYCQYDMRKITSTLTELKSETRNLSDHKIEEYFKTSKKKDIDFDLFKTTGEIFHEYKNIEDCNKKYKMESVMLPLMIHQNYKKSINESVLDFNE